MKYNIKSLIGLIILGFILFCAQAPQQIAKKALAPTEKAKESTVQLVNRDSNSKTFGSGFFVDKDKIATNIHVIAQSGTVFAKLSGKETTWAVEGVVASDVKNNLVILKIAAEGTPLPLGDSDAVHIGESISIVGLPEGEYQATAGTIDSIQKSDKWFWIEAATSKESSGDPVLNSNGEVIGITVGYGEDSDNYAIPSNALKALLARLMPMEPLTEWQKRPYIRAESYHSQGEQKYAAKKYKNAIVKFNKALKLNLEHVRAYYKRGRTKYKLDDYKGAIDDYTSAIKLNLEHARAYYNRGIAKYDINDYANAINDYTHAIKIDPKDADFYNSRGVAKFRLSESKYNSDDVEKALHLYQEAIDDWTQTINIDPEDATAYYNRGIVKSKLGDIESESGDSKRAQRLYHEGIVDYGKSVQLKYTEDTNAPTARIKSKKHLASTVNVMKWTGNTYFGSGFFVDKDKIATNIHVVARPGPVYVKLINNETIWKVEEVTAFDVENDIVVLKISGEGTPLSLGNSAEVQIGDSVVTVGYPSNRYKVTKGKVHNIRNRDKWIVITTTISAGNSGGPLLNSKEEVIGILAYSIGSSGNRCISVPSNILKALLSQSVSSEPFAQWQQRDQIRAYADYGIGQDYCIAGNYNKALINFEKAILHYPRRFDIYDWSGQTKHNLGKSKESQGDVVEAEKLYKAAIEDYTHAIKIDSENASAFSDRGNVKYDLGESKAEQGDTAEAEKLYKTAIEDYTHAIKIDSENASIFSDRGSVKYDLGESKAEQGDTAEAEKLYKAAVEDWTQAIKLNPEDAVIFFNRGVTKYFLGESKAEQGDTAEAEKLYKAAVEDWTQAIKLNPEDADTFNNRGVAKKALGQHEAAEKDFAKAKELESKK